MVLLVNDCMKYVSTNNSFANVAKLSVNRRAQLVKKQKKRNKKTGFRLREALAAANKTKLLFDYSSNFYS